MNFIRCYARTIVGDYVYPVFYFLYVVFPILVSVRTIGSKNPNELSHGSFYQVRLWMTNTRKSNFYPHFI